MRRRWLSKRAALKGRQAVAGGNAPGIVAPNLTTLTRVAWIALIALSDSGVA